MAFVSKKHYLARKPTLMQSAGGAGNKLKGDVMYLVYSTININSVQSHTPQLVLPPTYRSRLCQFFHDHSPKCRFLNSNYCSMVHSLPEPPVSGRIISLCWFLLFEFFTALISKVAIANYFTER